MKASIYFNYTTRSLIRGGQRTLLSLFCIAVGVMAIVALQSVGEMVNQSFTSNIRDANGGDIALSSISTASTLTQNDLHFFDSLKNKGIITAYTPTSSNSGTLSAAASATQHFSLLAVNPTTYPIVTPPSFKNPSSGTVSGLLSNDQVIVDQNFADQYNKKVGDKLDAYVAGPNQSSVVLHVQIAAVVADDGVLTRSSSVMLVSVHAYQAALVGLPVRYDSLYATTVDKSHTQQARDAIHNQFPLDDIQTSDDALKAAQSEVSLIQKFLDIAGLLALLIGGVGIINTMQVLLSRRKTEIAMLKTVGYRRYDLYLLFGLEAGLLGLIGGAIGALAAVGLSAIVLHVVEQLFQLAIPFRPDPLVVGGGILIGLFTALIFGLMPIIQAANIRPLNVLRDLPGKRNFVSVLLTIGLLLLLSVLFCLMAIFILNDVVLGISAVYGTFVFLGILSLFFVLVVWIISILPVPERFNIGYLAIVIAGVLLSALLTLALPTFGILLLLVSLMGFVVVLLPRSWKANTKMALRNIGRQRGRTTTTLLALFVGVFTIGLILVLGQDLRDKLNGLISNNIGFNLVALTNGNDSSTLHSKISTIPGLSHYDEHSYAQVFPATIDGQSIRTLLTAKPAPKSGYSLPPGVDLLYLSSLEGYDVGHQQFPDTTKSYTIPHGRNLNASDANSDNVLVNSYLTDYAPLKGHLKLGSKITLASADGKIIRTVTVVGIYNSGFTSSSYGQILTPTSTVQALAGTHQTSVFYMKVDTSKIGKALNTIGTITPKATVSNFANIGDYINQYIGNILLVLILIASLSLFAGIIIIANAVALAMLERRRELGILKSVGYTSRVVLGEVLIENGIVGGTGALLAMLLVAFVTSLLDRLLFKSGFGVNSYIAIGLVVGVALIAIITATLVAWGSVRVRPLEVLRYE